MTKKVLRMFSRSRISRTRSVTPGVGPLSNVSVTRRDPTTLLHDELMTLDVQSTGIGQSQICKCNGNNLRMALSSHGFFLRGRPFSDSSTNDMFP